MRVALRRQTNKPDDPALQVDNLKMDASRRAVTMNGNPATQTPTEYEILWLLLQNAGKVLTHHQFLRQIWGTAYESEMHILRVNISNLRRKIEPNPTHPTYICTDPDVEYRFKVGLEDRT